MLGRGGLASWSRYFSNEWKTFSGESCRVARAGFDPSQLEKRAIWSKYCWRVDWARERWTSEEKEIEAELGCCCCCARNFCR